MALLLFAVPTLATLAKDSWYLPQSNPGHYLNIASKMQVPHCPILVDKAPLQTIANVVSTPDVIQSRRERDWDSPQPSIGWTASLQLRSPPSLSLSLSL